MPAKRVARSRITTSSWLLRHYQNCLGWSHGLLAPLVRPNVRFHPLRTLAECLLSTPLRTPMLSASCSQQPLYPLQFSCELEAQLHGFFFREPGRHLREHNLMISVGTPIPRRLFLRGLCKGQDFEQFQPHVV